MVGMCDRSGVFVLNLYQINSGNWTAIISFQLLVPITYKVMVDAIVTIFGVGKVYVSGKTAKYSVSAVSDLTILVAFFKIYSLVTKAKSQQFAIWAEAHALLITQAKLEGDLLIRLMAISAALGRGPSIIQKNAFPDIIPATLGEYTLPYELNPYWISGYFSVFSTFTACVRHGIFYFQPIKSWIHKFTVGFNDANGEIAQIIADIIGVSCFMRSSGLRYDISAQSDTECMSVVRFFRRYPINSPQQELLYAWGQYVLDSLSAREDFISSNRYEPRGALHDEGQLVEGLSRINAIKNKLSC